MSMQDPMADMLTRIRNALAVNKQFVAMPSSNLKKSIATVLKDEGFVLGFEETTENKKSTLRIDLKYFQGKPVISVLKQVSRPGLRTYKPVDELPEVKNGLGEAVVTTSKGVMTAKQAKKLGQGGEILFYVN